VGLDTGHPKLDADQLKYAEPIAMLLNATGLEILRRQLGTHALRVFTYARKPLANANTRAWRNAQKRAGIESFRWHDWTTWHRQG
jgi:hypothetical protein